MDDNHELAGRTIERAREASVVTSADRIAVPSDAVELMRNCIQAKTDGKPLEKKLRAAVIPICEEARRTQAAPEQVVISVKELCHSMPEYEKIRGAHERVAFLDSVIRVTIEEYYRA